MDLQQRPLKLHFIPYLAAGHLIPLCDIATLFASRGQHVTVSTTPSNAHILRESNPSLPNIHIHIVDFPSKEVGLPDGLETMTGVDGLANSAKLHTAAMLLRGPITRFIQQHPPDCIVADFVYPWVDDVANNLRIPRLAFNPSPLFAISAMESVKSHPTLHSETGPFVIPDFPHHITMYARPPKSLTGYTEPLLEIQLKSYGVILNNFEELDGEEYIQHYEKTTGHKVWHIGPAFMIRRTAAQERSHKSVVGELECLSWLNSKRLNSVVYICFGSMCHFPDQQLYEMACGIEQAGHNFIWVVPEKKGKEEESEGEKEKWLPKGFEERNKEKGMIIRGWAPQLLILAHSSLGAFLTHCGASSMLEGVSVGVPMITWPVQGDQFYSEKLVTQVQKIGVEVGVTEWKLIGFGERDKLVGRDSIEKAVKRLMDGGDEALEIRRRAKDFGEKAKAALQDGGSSHRNLTLLIEDLMRLRDSSK